MRHPSLTGLLLAAAMGFSPAVAVPAAAQPFKAVPVDEAGEDPALEALRDRLLAAVRRRDRGDGR